MNEKFLVVLRDNGAEIDNTIERFVGDKEMYFNFLSEFLNIDSLSKLFEAMSTGDEKIIMDEVHTIKGVALNLGLLPIGDICVDILTNYRKGLFDIALKKIPYLIEEFKRWIEIKNQF